jgi:CO/xanthine dehydrogenase Mo-binding subunit
MADYKVIGQRTPKVDGLERVTGKATYAADFVLPDLLHGKVLRSPHAHARILRLDTRQAEQLEGVRAVITARDMPPPAPDAFANLGETQIDMDLLRQLVLADKKAVFHGQAVAAVAALTPEIAEEALGLIEVDYEPLPVVEDVEQAMRPDAPLIHEDLYTEGLGPKATAPSNIAAHLELARGDVDRAFREADAVVEGTYRSVMVHQGYIEPQAATARVDSDGRVTLWCTTQGSFTIKMQIAALLNLPLSKVKVVPMEIGGGFGGKIYVNLEPLCVLLAQKSGRPVRIVMTRDEVFRATGPASPAVIWVKAGAKKDGTLTAIQGKLIYDAGAFKGSPVSAAILVGFAAYPVPNLRLDGYDVVTNKPRVNAYRAPGGPPAAFAVESTLDDLAQRLGIDPLDFRIKNCAKTGDPGPNDVKFNRIGLQQILDRVRHHPAWTTPLDGHPNRGRGLAVGYWRGAQMTSSCTVSITPDGTPAVVLGSVDLTGTRTTMAQVAAEELGFTPEEVSVTMADTESAPYTDVTGGSRITYTMSTAVHRACRDVIAQFTERAARRLQVKPDEVEYADRTFRVKGSPDRKVTLKELALASAMGSDGPVIGRGTTTRLAPAPAFAVHVADVEVDPETGKVTILNYTVFQDAGCAINPTQVEGQMQGGAAQGIGWALTEGYVFDRGVMRNPTLLDYRMMTALDLPMIDPVIVEVPAAEGPYGARGVGEVPICPPPATLANAIKRAVGVRMTQLPMNPEAVFWAVREKQGPAVGG